MKAPFQVKFFWQWPIRRCWRNVSLTSQTRPPLYLVLWLWCIFSGALCFSGVFCCINMDPTPIPQMRFWSKGLEKGKLIGHFSLITRLPKKTKYTKSSALLSLSALWLPTIAKITQSTQNLPPSLSLSALCNENTNLRKRCWAKKWANKRDCWKQMFACKI